MKTYRIACIFGDGIGKEVVPAGEAVLRALAANSTAKSGTFGTWEEIENLLASHIRLGLHERRFIDSLDHAS